MKVNRFILSSDFASLRNDNRKLGLEIRVPAGFTFDQNTGVIGTADIIAGSNNALLRASWIDYKYPTLRAVGTSFLSDVRINIGGSIAIQTLYCELARINSSTLRVTLATGKNPGAPTHTLVDAIAIDFSFVTFLSPFN